MHERTNIHLSRSERSSLEAVVANRNSPQKHVWRAKIVLLTANGCGTAKIMQATGKAKTVIWRWQQRFRDEGAAGLWRDKTRRSRIPPLSPQVAKRVVALTLAGPPPAASHWTGSAMAKAAGLYMICTISKHKAEREGYADAMMLDWQDRVAECTGANIFFIKDGKIHTPIADCFLAGITRATAIDLAKRRGIEVIERRIMPDELAGFSECFITGTAAEITPVSEIAKWKFTPGAISEQLMADYTAEVQPKGKAAAA